MRLRGPSGKNQIQKVGSERKCAYFLPTERGWGERGLIFFSFQVPLQGHFYPTKNKKMNFREREKSV